MNRYAKAAAFALVCAPGVVGANPKIYVTIADSPAPYGPSINLVVVNDTDRSDRFLIDRPEVQPTERCRQAFSGRVLPNLKVFEPYFNADRTFTVDVPPNRWVAHVWFGKTNGPIPPECNVEIHVGSVMRSTLMPAMVVAGDSRMLPDLPGQGPVTLSLAREGDSSDRLYRAMLVVQNRESISQAYRVREPRLVCDGRAVEWNDSPSPYPPILVNSEFTVDPGSFRVAVWRVRARSTESRCEFEVFVTPLPDSVLREQKVSARVELDLVFSEPW